MFWIFLIAPDHKIRLQRRLVCDLQSRHFARLALTRHAVDTLRITLHTNLQRTIDIDLDKSRNSLTCAVSIGSTIRSSIENDAESLLGKNFSNECQRCIEVFTIPLVVSGVRREHLSQRIGLENHDV